MKVVILRGDLSKTDRLIVVEGQLKLLNLPSFRKIAERYIQFGPLL